MLMKHKITITLLLLMTTVFYTETLSQKVFKVNLKFPPELDTALIKIRIDNGKGERRILPIFFGNEVIISDTFYSRYAYLSCTYPSKNPRFPFSNSFFIGDTAASIIFSSIDTNLTTSFLWNCTVENVQEIAKIKEAELLTAFSSAEFNDLKNFLNAVGDQFYTNDSIRGVLNFKSRKISYKKIEFIKQNGSSYYSFWLFRSELINSLSADTMLKIYESAFTQDLKNSFEGNEIETILKERMNAGKIRPAPHFKAFDINNKPVDLGTFKGKYVILDFWASWCVPCIAEMPMLKELNDKYADKLVLISISRDHDIIRFKKDVKNNKMDWINIFNDQNIENLYGKKGAIPQVYLINPNGDLIYNNEEGNDYQLKKLISIIEVKL